MPNPISPNPYPQTDGGTGHGTNYGNQTDEDLANLFADTDASGTHNPKNYQTKTCKLVVKYHANGGTGDPPSDSVQTYSGARQEVTFTHVVEEKPEALTRAGYQFIGWSTSSSATEPNKDPGDKITKTWSASQSGTVTHDLYAVWVNSGIFWYSPDEDSNESKAKFAKKNYPGTSTLRGALFTRKGYNQIGWKTEDGHQTYECGENYTATSDDVLELYPIWEPNVYKVTYNPNGGVGQETTVNVTYDQEITIPDYMFVNEGYYIEYWNEANDGTKTNWFPGKTYVYQRDENITLYPVWAGWKYYILYDDEEIHSSKVPAVVGDIYTDLVFDENDCLYSESGDLHKDINDMLYMTYPGVMAYQVDEEQSTYYSIATYGSPFYTDRRPISKYCYSLVGWESDDGIILKKQNAWLDSYSFGEDPTYTRRRGATLRPIWSGNYPYGRLFFGEKESSDNSLIICRPPSYVYAEYPYVHNKANGRNGDIITDPNKYENIQKNYVIAAYDQNGFYSAASKLSEFLHKYNGKGYVRLEDTYEPDIYMLGVYEDSGNIENILAEAGITEISFNCKPQKFLISGDRKIEIVRSGMSVNNPTNYTSAPIIRIRGTGSVTVSGVKITIVENFNGIILDADTFNAVDRNGRNMNSYIAFDEPIRLYPGDNVIEYEGEIEKVSIVPKWWKV